MGVGLSRSSGGTACLTLHVQYGLVFRARFVASRVLFLDSEESFGPDGISLRGALEAGGP